MNKNTSKVTIKGPLRDLWRFIFHITQRRRIFRRSTALRPAEKHGLMLKESLHPEVQFLRINKIRKENNSTISYTMIPDPEKSGTASIAPFRSGQYLSIDVLMDSGMSLSRPYSISNTPEEARKDNAYVITVKTGSDAFIPEVITDTWKIGTAISASDPCGQFYYDSLRDSSHLVCIAGGSGITPFRSMISDVLSKHENLSVVMIQGAENAQELLFSNFFLNLEKSDSERFKWIPVLSLSGEEDLTEKINHQIFRGFINADILSRALGNHESSVFICGPEAMHQHIDAEIEKAKLKPKRIRREDYGIQGHPEGKKPVELTVKMAGIMYQIPADRDETVLVALERAGLNPPSRCRTGSCGWCRGSLLDGKIRYDREPDGLRSADRKGGYFHPCAAKPESNLIIDIPGKPGLKK